MPKRSSGIRKRTDSTGAVTYQANILIGGKRYWATKPTEREAIQWRARMLTEGPDQPLSGPLTMRDMIARFLRENRPHWAAATAEYYREVLEGNIEKRGGSPLMRHWGDRLVDTVRGPELQTWLNKQLEAGKKPRTVNIYRQCLATLFRWAVRMELVKVSPMTWVKGARVRREAPPRVLRLHELQALLSHAGERRLFWLFLALTGLRRSEVYRMRWDWLDLEGGWLKVKQGKTGYGEVPLAQVLVDELRHMPRHESGHVFGDGSQNTQEARGALARTLKAANLDPDGIGFHTFRRTYITMLERLPGVSYSVVKTLARHSMIGADITARYLMPPEEALRKAIDDLAEQVTTESNVVRMTAAGGAR